MNYVYIYGFEGQDGTLLTNYLLDNAYRVIGVSREKIIKFDNKASKIIDPGADLFLHYQPKCIFYFAAYHQSSENIDNANSKKFLDVNFSSFVDIVEKIKAINHQIPIIYASSKLIFGNLAKISENSISIPSCDYSYTKSLARLYIEYSNKLHSTNIYNCILFNHESKYRKSGFLIKKIHDYCKLYSADETECLYVNNSSSFINFCTAHDFVLLMNELIQSNMPGDYVFCNDQSIQIRDVVEVFFRHYGIPLEKLVDLSKSGARVMSAFEADNKKLKSVVKSGYLLEKSYETIIGELIDEISA